MGEAILGTFPKVVPFLFAIAVLVISVWHRYGVLSKRNYWFTFLKLTEAAAILALIELTSRWYWFARTQESVISAMFLAVVGAMICVVIYGTFIFCSVVFVLGTRRFYRFCLNTSTDKMKLWLKRKVESNWRRADSIVEKGVWKTFFD